jgi:hypothetical protein
MTLLTTQPRYQYTGNGVSVSFAMPAKFIDPADLTVVVSDAAGNTIGGVALNGGGPFGYTVTGTLDAATGEYLAGGAVVFNAAIPSGDIVTIFRDPPETQLLIADPLARLPAGPLNTELDKLTMEIQALSDRLGRAITAPVTEPVGQTFPLANATARANKILGFDGAGNLTLLTNPLLPTPPIVQTAAGRVEMIRISDSTNNLSQLATWIVYKPDGTLLNIAGSPTQGLQEAINYAVNNGYELVVRGGGVKPASAFGAYNGQDPAIIDCSTGITVPPLEFGRIDIGAVTINFHPSVAVGFLFDSLLDCNIRLCEGGQIVMGNANGIGVSFTPTNQVPEDSAFGIGVGGSNTVFIGPITIVGVGTGIGVQFNTTNGPIQQGNHFIIPEIFGGNIGIALFHGAHAFAFNVITARFVHGQSAQSIQIGQSATNAQLIGGNKWQVDLEPAASGIALDTWSQGGDYYQLSATGGGPSPVLLKFESSADGNIVDLIRPSLFTVEVQDISGTRGNSVRAHIDYIDADLNSVNQAGIANTTYTKVNWSRANYNLNLNGGVWSAGRWTPGRTGTAFIGAQVMWNAPTDGSELRTAIYKNGALLCERLERAKGTGTQGAHIARGVHSDNSTDYFEIFAYQATGGALDISGIPSLTWATFKMWD